MNLVSQRGHISCISRTDSQPRAAARAVDRRRYQDKARRSAGSSQDEATLSGESRARRTEAIGCSAAFGQTCVWSSGSSVSVSRTPEGPNNRPATSHACHAPRRLLPEGPISMRSACLVPYRNFGGFRTRLRRRPYLFSRRSGRLLKDTQHRPRHASCVIRGGIEASGVLLGKASGSCR